MAFEKPTQVPNKFTAGDSFIVQVSSIDFPAGSGWTLAISMRGPTVVDATATASGSDYLFNVPGATTKAWSPGTYFWQLRVSNDGGEVHTLQKGRIDVLPDYSAVTDQNFSDKSQAEQTLDGLFAVLAVKKGTATPTQTSTAAAFFTKRYKLDGVDVERADPAQIIVLIEKFQRIVARERNDDHLNPKKRRNRVFTRFS